MSIMHDCRAGTYCLYNPVLLGNMKDDEDLAASSIEFAPCVWLDSLLGSGNNVGAASCENAFASLDSHDREFTY